MRIQTQVTLVLPGTEVVKRSREGSLTTTGIGVQTEKVVVTIVGDSHVPSPDLILSDSFVNKITSSVSQVERVEGGGFIKTSMSPEPPRAQTWCSMLGDLEDLRLSELCDKMIGDLSLPVERLERGSEFLLVERPGGVTLFPPNLDDNGGFTPSHEAWLDPTSRPIVSYPTGPYLNVVKFHTTCEHLNVGPH